MAGIVDYCRLSSVLQKDRPSIKRREQETEKSPSPAEAGLNPDLSKLSLLLGKLGSSRSKWRTS